MDVPTDGGMCLVCGANITGNRYGGIPYTEALRMHNAYHANMVSREEAKAMSAVAWCDPGDHAFKANSPGAQRVNMTQTNEDGNPVNMQMDICPEHAMNPRKVKALSATVVDD